MYHWDGPLGCLPANTPNYCLTVSVAFAASLQTETFRAVKGNRYNSTFMTGNLRSLSESLFALGCGEPAPLAKLLAIICTAFFAGSLFGAFLTPRLMNKTLWVVCIFLGCLLPRLLAGREKESG